MKKRLITSIAKISAPKASGTVERERLFRLLDQGREKPVVWIAAPAGSGKTTLVSGWLDNRRIPSIWYQIDSGDADPATFFMYLGLAAQNAAPKKKKTFPVLTPEYLMGIPVFSRRFFENVFSRLPSPAVIVLDNYQDAPADSPLHEILRCGIDAAPAGITFVVLSRCDSPPQLSRIRITDRLHFLGWLDLRFSVEESKTMAISHGCADLDDDVLLRLHAKANGWAAGLALLLRSREQGPIRGPSLKTPAVLFDYFAEEIFRQTDGATRDFLLKTSFFPSMTVSMAERISGNGDACAILDRLNREHYFIESHVSDDPVYQYHPLFREFLLNRAKSLFAPDAFADIQREAARLLEQSGQIEDAARLYSDAGDGAGLARIVTRHARELLLQGRNQSIREWMASLPAKTVNDDPWLLYWSGMCSFPMDLPGTRQYLEQALALFRMNEDLPGIYLSWAGIVDSYAFGDEWKSLDNCITVFDDLTSSYPSFPSLEIELVASSRMLLSLTLRKTNQPERVERWFARVSALLQENPSFDIQMDIFSCMSLYYFWKGEYDKNALLLERAVAEVSHGKASAFAVIRIKLMSGIHCWITADYQAALQALSEGLDVSAQSGVHLYDSLLWSFKAAAEMAHGEMENAENSMKHQLKSLLGMENALNSFWYYINSAWHALLTGNPSRAAGHMETAFARTESMGTPYYQALWHVAMAQVAFLQGRASEARTLVRTAHRISLTMKSLAMEWYSLLIDAWILLREGEETEGLLSLHRALSLGRKQGYVHLEFYQPEVMRFLFAKALGERIEREYVKGLIRKLGLTPPQPLEEWPYPIKICTLGRFEILKDDEPLVFSGKVPKKPLELLKALIAFGGREVSRDRVTDALWPDADGDRANNAFKFALHQLRLLLNKDTAVTLHNGHVAFDPRYCRIDAVEFMRLSGEVMDLCRKADHDLSESETRNIAALARQAMELYGGDFLPNDVELPWTAPVRHKLRERMQRMLNVSGHHTGNPER